MSQEHPDFVTVCKGVGFFASHWSWTHEADMAAGGYYCPYQTVSPHYDNADQAEEAARGYAAVMDMEFKPWTEPFRTLAEADRYYAIYREEMAFRRSRMNAFRTEHPDLKGPDFFRAFHAIEPLGAAGDRARARYKEGILA